MRTTISPIHLAFVVGCFLGALSPALAEGPKKEQVDRAFQVHQMFRKRCAECHSGPRARNHLDLLKTADVLRKVQSGAPEDSEIVDYVKGLMMPPGTREKVPATESDVLEQWIKDDAPAPLEEDADGYALWCIIKDLEKIKGKEKDVRYISFEHLRDKEGKPLPRLCSEKKQALQEALEALRRKDWGPAVVEQIDPTVAVFRLSLDNLHWSAKPYDNKPLTLFDLVLLEYPYGELPVSFLELYEELEKFLIVSRQVRPLVYVDGDWFITAIQASPLIEDLHKCLGLDPPMKKGQPWAGPPRVDRTGRLPILPIDALSIAEVPSRKDLRFDVEVGLIRAEDLNEPELRPLKEVPATKFRLTDKSLASLKDAGVRQFVLDKLKPLKNKEFTSSEDFLNALVGKLDKGVLEGWKNGLPDHVFNLKTDYRFKATGDDAWVETVFIDEEGKISWLYDLDGMSKPRRLAADKPRGMDLLVGEKGKAPTWPAGPKGPIENTILVFAFPATDLPNKELFPKGKFLEAKGGVHERIIHESLYKLPLSVDKRWPGPDPARMIKRTFKFTVLPGS